MQHILRIARYEYGRHVRRRGFLFTAFGLPLFLVVMVGLIVGVTVLTDRNNREARLGLVDQTGRFARIDPTTLDLNHSIPVQVFGDETAARAAFDARSISAYFVVPANYVQSGTVRAVTRNKLSSDARDELYALLRTGLLSNTPADVRARLDEPLVLAQRTLNNDREIGAGSVVLFAVPYLFALLFFTTTFTSSGYLLQAITEEKEDRVMEILATTVSPTEMMAGKILGLAGVGLTQILIWLGIVGIGLGLVVANTGVGWLAHVPIPWSMAGWALVYFVLGYLLISACYALAGAAVPTVQDAQPLVGPVSLLSVAPMMLLLVILSRPNSTLALVFSLIPFSAPITMLLRLAVSNVPLWQLALSLVLLALAATGTMLLAARVMRRGMLRYGKRLNLREIFGS